MLYGAPRYAILSSANERRCMKEIQSENRGLSLRADIYVTDIRKELQCVHVASEQAQVARSFTYLGL